jgi:hypothetical protein
MNKEDMWVSKIPIPVRDKQTNHINENFSNAAYFNNWNIYSPLWCKVGLENNVLVLHDSDPFDYAKAERVFPGEKKVAVEFSVTASQDNYGLLHVELADAKGTPCLRLLLDSSGSVLTKQGYRNKSLGKYKAGEKLVIRIELNTSTRFYTVSINGGNPANNLCFAPVASVERIIFRTGEVRRFPDADTPTDQDYDLHDANARNKEAVYQVEYLKTSAIK